jgi:signal transduction histidine kinase
MHRLTSCAFCNALSLGSVRFLDFQQLEQASLNKSQFLRRMSHDLRSPMNAIIGYTRLLLRRTADRLDEHEQRNLHHIETSANNLLSNAVKFTESGSIALSVEPVENAVELTVAGIGIPSEDLPHIFEEFRQVDREGGAQAQGTGLGLTIVKKLVELLGGTIAAESEIGQGTRFALRIGSFKK